MAVIPIVLEGQRQPVRRPTESKYGYAESGARRGSYGRIIAAANNERKGSYIRKGSYGRIPLTATSANAARRGSNGRIAAVVTTAASSADSVLRRGSIGGVAGGRRGSGAASVAADIVSRRGSIGRKQLEETARRGSIARRGSETKFQTEQLLNRRSSGASSRHLVKKGSRQNLKSFQIKISIEGEDEEFEKKKDCHSNKKDCDGNGQNEKRSQVDKENVPVVSKVKEDLKDVKSRWSNVDRGVAHVRGGGDIKLEPIPVNTIRSTAANNQRGATGTAKQALGRGIANKSSPTATSKAKAVDNARSLAQFGQEATERHNKYRAVHGAKPLTLDTQLSKHAQKYAEKLANSCTFQHSGDPVYGENLYWAWSSDPAFALKGAEAVDSWYEESLQCYNYSHEPTDTESGHFTQLVWKRSERLGVGLAKSSAGRHIVVIKYDPPGNYVGQYTANVMPPLRASGASTK